MLLYIFSNHVLFFLSKTWEFYGEEVVELHARGSRDVMHLLYYGG
ncbi:hypothetical protein WSQ_06030 [Anaplasma phagocytophilum str. JM]|nr:hypothetical protein WSQ_06030 [Anaplasma phagocytophilum str. JM]KJV59479.1 hypothetical protein APHWEB_0663 [Anaplasma phagocytophilum str. Webster]